MMLRVGVTGSNGFIGGHLCRDIRLNDNKFELIAFNRDWFDDSINLDAFVDKCDVIIHLAGINRHSDSGVIFNTNIRLTNSLISSFERTKFKGHVLFSSSTQEERDNTFGNSKKISRELFTKWAKKSGASFKGLIIPNVFGAFGKPYYNSVISTFCHQLINNEIPQIDNDVALNLIYVNELTNLIIDLIDIKSIENINIRHTASYKVSEILRYLEIFSEKYFRHGQIPSLKNNFELNLFNSFRSHINLIDFFPVKYKKNVDERGNFVEIIRLETGGQVSFSTTKKGITRGNHFHTRKIERFSVLKGKALIQLRKFGTSETLDFYLTGDEPAFVDMPIWYTHNIKNVGDEELFTMFWINEFYDVKDPDTYFEIV
jgi:UDP-2-acetamido-2,6-beta-L-arabino-hexul-4-ose reductase